MIFTIRKARSGDGKAFIEFWNAGARRKFFTYNGGGSLRKKSEAQKKNADYSKQTKNNFVMFAFDKKKIIGAIFVNGSRMPRKKHCVSLGWLTHPDYARQGVATNLLGSALKALEKAGVKRVEAEAALENVASIKLAKKYGFKIEGQLKKALLLDDGRYVDTYLFGKILN